MPLIGGEGLVGQRAERSPASEWPIKSPATTGRLARAANLGQLQQPFRGTRIKVVFPFGGAEGGGGYIHQPPLNGRRSSPNRCGTTPLSGTTSSWVIDSVFRDDSERSKKKKQRKKKKPACLSSLSSSHCSFLSFLNHPHRSLISSAPSSSSSAFPGARFSGSVLITVLPMPWTSS